MGGLGLGLGATGGGTTMAGILGGRTGFGETGGGGCGEGAGEAAEEREDGVVEAAPLL